MKASRMRAVSSARSTYRPSQNSDSAIRLSINRPPLRLLLLLLLLLDAVGSGAHEPTGDGVRGVDLAVGHVASGGLRKAHVVGELIGGRGLGREHPRVLGAAALTGVHDQRPLAQRHPGKAARQHPDAFAV